jgi:hypothetical protein
MHLQTEDPDEHDYVISVPIKGKDNTSRYYYSRHSENFNKLKAIQYMIMVKSSNFKMLQEKQKKNMLVQSYSYYESLS